MTDVVQPTFEGDWTSPSFWLDCGVELRPLALHYAVYGTLNKAKTNAILICHALSGSARVADWWPQMFGAGGVFDTGTNCFICVNVIGSCYGSCGPVSNDLKTGQPYGPDFPLVTIHDTVRAQAELLECLGIKRLRAVIGGSIGGMQALAWAIGFPDRLDLCVAIGACRLSALGLALNHLQRQALQLDPRWNNGRYPADGPPRDGLALARGIAMCTYKSAELFDKRFGRKPNRSGEDPFTSITGRFDVAGYLDYQGAQFHRRFDANSYVLLSKAMDTFEYDRADLNRIRARVLLVGISSDWLFAPPDVRALAQEIADTGANCEYAEIASAHGHDAFLAEPELLFPLLTSALKRVAVPREVENELAYTIGTAAPDVCLGASES